MLVSHFGPKPWNTRTIPSHNGMFEIPYRIYNNLFDVAITQITINVGLIF
jgi:hypothetical protein